VQGTSRFAAVFFVLSTLGLAVYFFPYEQIGVRADVVFQAYLAGYARAVGWVLGVLDPAVRVTGVTIGGRFPMQIARSCDAMEANILFGAATLALPAALPRKAVALVVGLAALVAVNIARLCCLYYVGIYAPARFDFAHYEAWPLIIVGFAAADFLVCARWLTPGGPPSGVGPGGANVLRR
jgi:exosortase/archaeosortase family protein